MPSAAFGNLTPCPRLNDQSGRPLQNRGGKNNGKTVNQSTYGKHAYNKDSHSARLGTLDFRGLNDLCWVRRCGGPTLSSLRPVKSLPVL